MSEAEEIIIEEPSVQNEREILLSSRSEEVQEIVGRMPSWIIRYGISLLGCIVAGFFVLAYFVKYPDVVPVQISISSSQPPVKIVSPSNGNIEKLFVQNNQIVELNTPLYLINSSADYEIVQTIARRIMRADSFLSVGEIVTHLPNSQVKQLGELQQAYNQLQLAKYNYLYFVNRGDYSQRVRHLQSQISQYNQLNNQIQRQGNKLAEQRAIEKRSFDIDSSLVAKGIMTAKEYRDAKMKFIDRDISTDNTQSQKIQNKLQQSEYRKNIAETKQERQVRLFELGEAVKEKLQNFISQYQLWNEKYIVKSPIQGKVNFFSVWKENQFVQAGQGIMMITPKIEEINVRGVMGLQGAGKVEKGQKVLIKLTPYPYQEFGVLRGEISSLSPVAMDSVYSVAISLNSGLKTSIGKVIPTRAQLTGIGEIVTSDKSVFERLFEKVKLQTD